MPSPLSSISWEKAQSYARRLSDLAAFDNRHRSGHSQRPMKTILLLLISNIFMTFAWDGHLKYRSSPLSLAVLASWNIAFVEYCFQVPANRIG